MTTSIQDLAFIAGIILGGLMLISVSWVWIRRQVFGWGGSGLTAFGFALVGLTVWTKLHIEAGPSGITADFEQRLNELHNMIEDVDTNVQQVAKASLAVSNDVEDLEDTVASNGMQFQMLTRELQQSNVLTAPALDRVREGIVIPQADRNAIELRNRELGGVINR